MLNVGIVGCGYWGPNLIRNFNSLLDCNVKKVCDVDEDMRNEIRCDVGCVPIRF